MLVGGQLAGGHVEISFVRRRLMAAIDRARKGAQQRRERTAEREEAYETFLANVAVPVTRMLVNALKAERYAFTMATPGGGLRLVSDTARDDFIELTLDTSMDPPEVVARISRARGSRTLTEERPVKPGASPATITEEDVLEFLVKALEPWLER